MNLGEVMSGNGKAEMNVTTGLQQFALIVTAEPYSVTTPSDLVVMQNTIKQDKTTGILDTVMRTSTCCRAAPTCRRLASTRTSTRSSPTTSRPSSFTRPSMRFR